MNKFTIKNKGVTLIELMLVLAIFGIISTIIFSMNLFGIRIYAKSEKNAEDQFETRMPTDFIAKKLRYANSIKILSSIPSTPTSGAHQIYLESGRLVYKEHGLPSTLIGASDVNDYTFTIGKKAGTSNIVTFTIGKAGTATFDLSTDVIALNLDRNGITGDSNGIYVEFFTNNADAVTPVSIIGLVNPPPKNVNVNNVVSMPIRVTANMSNATTRQVAVIWSPNTIDTSAAGIKISTGRVVGYNGTVQFTVYVGNYEIKEIPEITITLNKGQAYTLPDRVPAVFKDVEDTIEFNDNVEVINWKGSIDTNDTATQTVYGEVSNPAFQAKITANINSVYVVSVSNIVDTVNQGVSYSLPTEVTATMNDGTSQLLPVTWSSSSLSTMVPGTYSVTGIVAGYGTPITLTLVVNRAKVPTPTCIITSTDNSSSTIKITGLVGSTAIVRDKNGKQLASQTIGASGYVELTIQKNQLHDVILTKAGWYQSDAVEL